MTQEAKELNGIAWKIDLKKIRFTRKIQGG